ncbi:glutamate 5-kinase [Streptococcus gordonii]|uniref:glutamate 5-kinase n=1 Tax=Streptococcus gordonii TaxID=1302 RepID=UPI00073CC731|nr:glutamate 5-kinase [Streptococcus gordonii]KTF20761.1 glutamate 5-kinase [Streptococcus gordonii]KXC04179.1 glutamate 5-kinase [Streptococcus gordonii]MBZ2149999.1 glutamate 5-kinase [Streptococcus gordonii]QWZ58299.1 glutamate 5-kinase [Streptococcus gordonii]SQF29171.1 gamma-glutamyl kinase [Streptococcus gordonii]
MKAKRIVFKVGTSSLTNADGSLSRAKVKEITRQLALLHEAGYELILVSSGAVAAGFSSLGFKKRPTKVADKQASAAVGQGLLLEEYTTNLLLKQIISAQILLTQDDFADKRRYKNAHQALSVLLNRGAIPIINENDTVAIEELKVGDNDTLSAQVAAMVQADLLVLLTDVDGLYTANPSINPDARRLEKIEKISSELIDMAGGAGTSNGTGGMLTKIKAATLATMSGVPVYICSSLKTDALLEAAEKTKDGSLFLAQEKGLKTQKQWLAFYAKSQGEIYVDKGAADALRNKGKSLLVSGLVSVSGSFTYQDTVTVYEEGSRVILGKGRVRFGKSALKDMLKSNKPKGVVIHRDDWISLTPELNDLFAEF